MMDLGVKYAYYFQSRFASPDL